MSEQKYFIILTSAGESEFTAAHAQKRHVEFSHVVLGDGAGIQEYIQPDRARVALMREVFRAPIHKIFTRETLPNQLHIQAKVPAHEGGFWVREIGVIGANGQLLAIGNYPASYKPAQGEGGLMRELTLTVVLETTGVLPPDTVHIQLENVEHDEIRIIAQNVLNVHTTHPDPHPQYVTHEEGAALVQQHRLSVGAGLTETTVGGARSVALPTIEGLSGWKNGLHIDAHGRVSAVHQVRTGKNDGSYRLRFAGENDYAMSADDVGAIMTAWGAENRTITLPPTPSPGDVVRLTNGSQYPKTLQAAPGTTMWAGIAHVQTLTLPGASHLEAFWDSVCWICRIMPIQPPALPSQVQQLIERNNVQRGNFRAIAPLSLVYMHPPHNAFFHIQAPAHVLRNELGQTPRHLLLQASLTSTVHVADVRTVNLYAGPFKEERTLGNIDMNQRMVLSAGSDDSDQNQALISACATFMAVWSERMELYLQLNVGSRVSSEALLLSIVVVGIYY